MMTITRHPAHPVAKKKRRLKQVLLTLKVDGSTKGNHKSVFAYAVQTACDKNGWILGYSVHPGNHHDSRSFKFLYDKIKEIGIKTLIADAGYKTPGIAKPPV